MRNLLTIFLATSITASAFSLTLDKQFEALIRQCSSINSGNYKCNSYLKLASYVQNLSRTKALEVIRECTKSGKYEDQIIVLTKLLFQAKKNTNLRRPYIGAAGFLNKTDYADWPTEPVMIINNIPFLITGGYVIGGTPEPAWKYLEYCIENGEWTENKYLIKNQEELNDGLKALFASKKWNAELTTSDKNFLKKQIE